MVVFKSQCDQIGLFSKVPDIKLSYKSMVTLGLFWKTSLLRKTIVGNFWKCMEYFLFQNLVTLSVAHSNLLLLRAEALQRFRGSFLSLSQFFRRRRRCRPCVDKSQASTATTTSTAIETL